MLEENNEKPIYTPYEWKDHIVKRQRTYYLTNNDDGTVTLTPVPDEVMQQGTPINAERLNAIEIGIQTAQNTANNIGEQLNTIIDEMLGGTW